MAHPRTGFAENPRTGFVNLITIMRINLTVTGGPHKGQEYSFAEHDTFLVGRSRHAHFQLPSKDRYFSRIHFMMEVNPPNCRLIDLGSHNGTFVNGAKVLVADLKTGDQIRAGHTTFCLQVVSEEKDSGELFLSPERSQVAPVPAEAGEISPLLLNLPEQIGDFQLVRELGRGHMGVTFLAQPCQGGDFYALKIIVPAAAGTLEQAHSFIQQAQALGGLHHPHIVATRELGECNGLLYFVTDYIPGTDAGRVVEEQGPLAQDRLLAWADQALQALEYAHAQGKIHRDIKPSNLLIRGNPGNEEVFFADFGLAYVYQMSQLSGLTMIQPGTAAFFPPEYITNYKRSHPAGDQYSLAATLYYLLTGVSPIDLPKGLSGQFSALLEHKAVPIQVRRPDLPDALAHPLDQALSRDPHKRFPDIASFRKAFCQIG